ncbi:unnamed protein product [Phytophthora lilii]|uniref:Unnamed protein product n=1 Tax=Phytophthora lilii TaxID=2077276 RepID=A0A9W7CI46_9STRA|nr:unnamed protein product [Phytophthora lilii]
MLLTSCISLSAVLLLLKHRESSCGVNTTQSSSQLDVIGTVYGSKLASELTAFEHVRDATAAGSMDLQREVRGYVSNANYQYVPIATIKDEQTVWLSFFHFANFNRCCCL